MDWALGGPRFDLARRRLARYQRQVPRPSDERLLGIGSQAARAAGMVAPSRSPHVVWPMVAAAS